MRRGEAVLLAETNLGSILGTVRYMSPEQACGAQVDKRTDIWSLGVVLYEMVTGHAPFTGDTPREVMSAILEKEPPPLTSYIKQTPAELQQIISKALRKDRERTVSQRTRAACRRSKIFATNWKSRLIWHAPLRFLYGCAGHGRPAALVLLLLVAALALALPFYRNWNLTNELTTREKHRGSSV